MKELANIVVEDVIIVIQTKIRIQFVLFVLLDMNMIMENVLIAHQIVLNVI
jgi:hypothetical protein